MSPPPSKPSEGRFLGHALGQVGANLISHGTGMIGGLITARILGPAQYGLIQGFKILYQFSGALSLGAKDGSRVLIPIERAKAGDDEAMRLAATGFWLHLVPQVVFCSALAVWASRLPAHLGLLRTGYLFSAATIALHALLTIFDLILLGYEKVRVRVTYQTLRALGNFFLVLPGVAFLGPPGFWYADWLSAWVLIPMTREVGLRQLLQFDASKVASIYQMGLPLFLSGQLQVYILQADRLLILSALGTEGLAYYAIATNVHRGLGVILHGVVGIWVPRCMRLMASGEEEAMEVQLEELSLALGWLAIWIADLGLIALVLLVEGFLPRYQGALAPALALAPSLYILGPGSLLGPVFLVKGWQTKLIPLMIAILGLGVALDVAALALGYGSVGVAAASSVSLLGTNWATLFLGFRLLGKGKREALAGVLRFYRPLLWGLGLGLLVGFGAASLPGSFSSRLGWGSFIHLVLLLPSVPRVVRTLDLKTRGRALFSRLRGKPAADPVDSP